MVPKLRKTYPAGHGLAFAYARIAGHFANILNCVFLLFTMAYDFLRASMGCYCQNLRFLGFNIHIRPITALRERLLSAQTCLSQKRLAANRHRYLLGWPMLHG